MQPLNRLLLLSLCLIACCSCATNKPTSPPPSRPPLGTLSERDLAPTPALVRPTSTTAASTIDADTVNAGGYIGCQIANLSFLQLIFRLVDEGVLHLKYEDGTDVPIPPHP